MKDIDWFSRQNPYVVLEYSNTTVPNLHRLLWSCSDTNQFNIFLFHMTHLWVCFDWFQMVERTQCFKRIFCSLCLKALGDLKECYVCFYYLCFLVCFTYYPYLGLGLNLFCYVCLLWLEFSCRRFFLRDTKTVPGLYMLKLAGNSLGFPSLASFCFEYLCL